MRGAFVRIATRAIWRTSPAISERAMARFAETEADSGWQFLQALRDAAEPEQRALLFKQAVEEYHHADLFACLAGGAPPAPVRARERIYDGDLTLFFARVQLAERGIFRQFNAYARAGDARLRDVIDEIIEDEREHDESAGKTLVQVAGAAAKSRALRRARAESMWRGWLRASRVLHVAFTVLVLSATYYVLLGLRRLTGARR